MAECEVVLVDLVRRLIPPVTAIMPLKVSRTTPYEVIDAAANTDMTGLIVRHPVRHQTWWHINADISLMYMKRWCWWRGRFLCVSTIRIT